MRACRAGLPLTVTVPAVGSIRSPITRSSVDLPQPDGPISETNSPGRDLQVDVLERGDIAPRERLRDALDRDDRRRSLRRLRRAPHDELLGDHDDEEEDDPEQRRDDVRRPQLLRLERVVLVEVDDRAAEAGLEAGRAARR